MFGAHGTVDRVNVVKDRQTGMSRGFAFVEMSIDDEADRAVQALDGAQLGTRRIRVNEARPQGEMRPSRPRPAGGGPPRGNAGGGGFGGRGNTGSTKRGPSPSSTQNRWWEE